MLHLVQHLLQLLPALGHHFARGGLLALLEVPSQGLQRGQGGLVGLGGDGAVGGLRGFNCQPGGLAEFQKPVRTVLHSSLERSGLLNHSAGPLLYQRLGALRGVQDCLCAGFHGRLEGGQPLFGLLGFRCQRVTGKLALRLPGLPELHPQLLVQRGVGFQIPVVEGLRVLLALLHSIVNQVKQVLNPVFQLGHDIGGPAFQLGGERVIHLALQQLLRGLVVRCQRGDGRLLKISHLL
mmetsp:Transcript_8155/g.20122  ORF Transcript_8155/g.20122 Transcript_8155/m.20122 type:complete len:237 (+) Transcript_8155:532-1242(+)